MDVYILALVLHPPSTLSSSYKEKKDKKILKIIHPHNSHSPFLSIISVCLSYLSVCLAIYVFLSTKSHHSTASIYISKYLSLTT